jgi:integrase
MTYDKKGQKNAKTEYKVSSFSGAFLTVSDVAQILGKTRKTISDWCKSGKLMATPKEYRGVVTYQIHQQAVEVYLQGQAALEEMKRRKKQIGIQDHSSYLEGWRKSAKAGLLGRRAYAENTLNSYESYLKKYLAKYKLLTFSRVKSELADCPPELPERRRGMYRSFVSFAKYLVMEEALDKDFLEKVLTKDFAPKSNPNPKQHVVSEEDLIKLIAATKTRQERAMLMIMANTGIRASECAHLKLEDVDLEKQEIWVGEAKYDEARSLGFNDETALAIRSYLEKERPDVDHPYLFVDQSRNPMRRDGVYQRVARIAREAGVYAYPHALRSRFVTHNLTMGRNPQDVQEACGHKSILTTMLYNRRRTQDRVDSMKNW